LTGKINIAIAGSITIATVGVGGNGFATIHRITITVEMVRRTLAEIYTIVVPAGLIRTACGQTTATGRHIRQIRLTPWFRITIGPIGITDTNPVTAGLPNRTAHPIARIRIICIIIIVVVIVIVIVSAV
tara:strand:- start:67 stop:453 length:387 start_codon:yes stop_codon:yes gene_type:complete